MFNMVWVAIKSNGHFSLGVGRVLHRNVIILVKLTSEYQMIRELRVDHASTENQKDENHLAKLRIFRSFGKSYRFYVCNAADYTGALHGRPA